MTVKITLNEFSQVDWEKVAAQIKEQAAKKIVAVTEEAMAALPNLSPGKSKTFPIKLGSIKISRSKE